MYELWDVYVLGVRADVGIAIRVLGASVTSISSNTYCGSINDHTITRELQKFRRKFDHNSTIITTIIITITTSDNNNDTQA